ncbi:MAG: sigma-54-dependent Fis family transcriptional regulator, partial [Candidatus Tectomicrobia bacterium]|nr:sigma-54-dependent Fis family transcriptional regulator [Candidatus Tectomicrobia bacterium]
MIESMKILIVEDDPDMADSCQKLFRRAGFAAEVVSSGTEALRAVERDNSVRIILTDLRMPEMDGVELLQRAKKHDPSLDVLIMTGYGTIQSAVQAIKIGATDYITKPFDKDELLQAVKKIVKMQKLQQEVSRLRSELQTKYRFDNIIGQSQKMKEVFEKMAAAAENDFPVLITGESGTGKELVAKAIHYSGLRSKGPFVPVNCGALPRDLIESELFGHKRGSFTGAINDAPGLFRSAREGTIFLDEIAEMSHDTQAKLLRALQEKRIRPVGEAKEVPVDIRIMAATNLDIKKALEDGTLREDLYYRLSVITINLPSLRERIDDLPLLVHHFIDKLNTLYKREIKGIEDGALNLLMEYSWPGNIR